MVTTVILNIAAFVIIFIEVEGYSEVRKSVIHSKKTRNLYFSHYVKKYIYFESVKCLFCRCTRFNLNRNQKGCSG